MNWWDYMEGPPYPFAVGDEVRCWNVRSGRARGIVVAVNEARREPSGKWVNTVLVERRDKAVSGKRYWYPPGLLFPLTATPSPEKLP
jgi:hypothetical protein